MEWVTLAVGSMLRAYLQGTPHTCRHSFATLALMAGRTLQDVADIMADDPATVARIYKHAYIPHQRKVIDFWPPQPQA